MHFYSEGCWHCYNKELGMSTKEKKTSNQRPSIRQRLLPFMSEFYTTSKIILQRKRRVQELFYQQTDRVEGKD